MNFQDLWGLEPITATAVTITAVIIVSVVTVKAIQNIVTNQEVTEGLQECAQNIIETANEIVDNIIESRSIPKGAPDSIEGIERDTSGSRNDRHAHGKKDEWAINEDGTPHDGNMGRVPKDAADFLRKRGFDIPEDRYPQKKCEKLED